MYSERIDTLRLKMSRKQLDKLDSYEQSLEDDFEKMVPVKNEKARIAQLVMAAKQYTKKKRAITIRVSEADLEAMQIKGSKLGIPYQTYINMLIHKDATSGFMQ
jgi:predicted DNA binding CopG/RHH family protein